LRRRTARHAHAKRARSPLGARIINICDSFRAMRDERVYKHAMSLQDALGELRRRAGTQFDAQLVEVFCRLVGERAALEPLRGRATLRVP
jgi:HD-GYP domain-containing protein (c-di-GMP phosphodiesterase class II)